MSRGLFVAVVAVLIISICWISPVTGPAALAQSAAADPSVTPTGSLRWDRFSHTATMLANGQVLAVGGQGFPCVPCSSAGVSCTGNYCSSTTNNTAELYDPPTGTWRLTGSLSRRGWHSATLLRNGHVLVVGGLDFTSYTDRYLNAAELYDPAAGVWRPTQSTIAIAGPNNSVLLPNGKVLVVAETVAELFDPATETWKSTGALLSSAGPLALLPDGNVLSVRYDSAQLYDPTHESWRITNSPNVPTNVGTLTLLKDGRVLATGSLGDAEIYDPATRIWSVTGHLNKARGGGPYSATLLPNGKVLVTGGWDPRGSDGVLSSAELYDPTTGTWTPMPNLSTRRTFHTATLLPDDKVLLVGGMEGDLDTWTISHNSAELFDLRLPRPTSLSISPSTVAQGQCFMMTVGNGSGMTLDLQYRYPGSPTQTLTGWPKLDGNGMAENICTSLQTPIGTVEFTAIRNTETSQWIPISTWLAVTP
jgi:WD40 repeat protein